MTELIRSKWSVGKSGGGTIMFSTPCTHDFAYASSQMSGKRIRDEANRIIAERNWLALVVMAQRKEWKVIEHQQKTGICKPREWVCAFEWDGDVSQGHPYAACLASELGIELPD